MNRLSLKNTIHGEARELTPYQVYEGTVEQSDVVANTFTVRLDYGRILLERCQWGAAIVSGMLGMKVNYRPTPGTRVLLVYVPSGSVVVGSMPSSAPYAAGAGGRSMTGQEGPMATKTRTSLNSSTDTTSNLGASPPADMLEGEFEINNMMGVGLALLTGLAKLSAGDLAKVECCLLNDMVRVVSQNYKHFSSFGNFEIYNDGRLNARWSGTSYDHEGWGKETAKETKAEASDDQVEVKLGEIDALNDTLRERFTQFVGFLGDFIHTYVTDPAVALGSAAQAQARSGKFHFHVNNDGSLIVQSVADIVLERVCRIVVPIERKRWDDPEGTTAKDYDSLAQGPLKAWKYDQNPENIFHAAYQLRHYARWLSGLHSLARFHQSTKDWEVPTEVQTPQPDRDAGESDKQEANASDTAYIETYATMRIMRDGSIVVLDGYGSSVTLAGGNVQLSAAKHLTLEAAGDLNLVAGQNINVKARRSIEVVAAKGGLTMKAKAWFRQISTHGSMWFRSDAPDPLADGYTAPTPDDEDEDPTPEVLPSAVVIQSKQGRFALESRNGIDVGVTARSLPSGQEAAITIRAPDGKITTEALKDVTIRSNTGRLNFKAATSIVMAGRNFISQFYGAFTINGKFTVRNGMLDLTLIRAKQVISNIVMSRKMTIPQDGNLNHVVMIPEGEENSATYAPADFGSRDGDDTTVVAAASTLATSQGIPIPAKDAADNARPGFNDAYSVTQIETQTQQRLRLETDTDERDKYKTWTWAQDRLTGELASPDGYPWPGANPEDLQASGGQPLHTPSGANYKTLANEAPKLQKSAKLFRFLTQESS